MNEQSANPFIDGVVRFINRLLLVFGWVELKYQDRVAYERRCWLSWYNRCEDAKGNPRGFPVQGCAHLYWHRKGKRTITFRWEWHLWAKVCGVAFGLESQERGIHGMLAFPPLALWWGIEGLLSPDWMKKHYGYEEREISIRIHHGSLWWSLWRDDNRWSSKESKWRVGSFSPRPFFLGKIHFEKTLLSTHEVGIPMPEGNYPATVELYEYSWSRPRWLTRRKRVAEVHMKKPIPFPGKGENSWDLEDDAIYGINTDAQTIETAIAKTVETAMKNRRRYGGDVMMQYPKPEMVPSP